MLIRKTDPTAAAVHVDGLLTDHSIGYKNSDYISDRVFPIISVRKQSDIIPQFEKSHWFRNKAALRAPGTKSVRSGFKVDNTLKYFSDRFSFGFELPDEVRDNADEPYNLDRSATDFVTDKLMMVRDVNFGADFMKTSVWKTDKTGTTDFTKWSTYGTSTLRSDIEDFKGLIEDLIAKEPNILLMGSIVWRRVKLHPDLLDAIKYTQTASVTLELAARLFELDEILVARAITTTTAEGTAEASVTYTRVIDDDALLMWRNASPGLFMPMAGGTYVWNRVTGAIQYIKRMRNEEAEMDIIESNSYFDQKLTASDAVLFIEDAVD